MILPESSNFGTLITYFNFVAWVSYGATFVSLLWLRYKRPELKRPYKVMEAFFCIYYNKQFLSIFRWELNNWSNINFVTFVQKAYSICLANPTCFVWKSCVVYHNFFNYYISKGLFNVLKTIVRYKSRGYPAF